MVFIVMGIILLIILYLLLFWGISKQIKEIQSYKEEISDKHGIIKQLEDKQLAYKELNLDESNIDDPLKMFEMFIDRFPEEDKFKDNEKLKILNLLSVIKDDKDMTLTSLVNKKDNLKIEQQTLLDSIFGDVNENN